LIKGPPLCETATSGEQRRKRKQDKESTSALISVTVMSLCVSAGGRVSYSYSFSYSGLRAVIRAPSRPPCAGTLEWFESGPDIPEEIAAQTPSSSQSATNSRIAALPLKIVI
ncbi:hypothetical protein L3Q82_023767, partial [Scortum barcoo]